MGSPQQMGEACLRHWRGSPNLHSVLIAVERSTGREVARQLRTDLIRPSVDPHVTD